MTANVIGYGDDATVSHLPHPKHGQFDANTEPFLSRHDAACQCMKPLRSLAIVGGFASGKTTLSDGLVGLGYTKVSFARYLKEICANVYNGGRPIDKYAEFVVTGPDGEPREISGRRMLQEFGQSVKAMDRNFWVRALLNDISSGEYGDGPFVTDDCRFPYEADALAEAGFIIVSLDTPIVERIVRYHNTYGVYPTRDEMLHASETEIAGIAYDYKIDGRENMDAILRRAYAIGSGEA